MRKNEEFLVFVNFKRHVYLIKLKKIFIISKLLIIVNSFLSRKETFIHPYSNFFVVCFLRARPIVPIVSVIRKDVY